MFMITLCHSFRISLRMIITRVFFFIGLSYTREINSKRWILWIVKLELHLANSWAYYPFCISNETLSKSLRIDDVYGLYVHLTVSVSCQFFRFVESLNHAEGVYLLISLSLCYVNWELFWVFSNLSFKYWKKTISNINWVTLACSTQNVVSERIPIIRYIR